MITSSVTKVCISNIKKSTEALGDNLSGQEVIRAPTTPRQVQRKNGAPIVPRRVKKTYRTPTGLGRVKVGNLNPPCVFRGPDTPRRTVDEVSHDYHLGLSTIEEDEVDSDPHTSTQQASCIGSTRYNFSAGFSLCTESLQLSQHLLLAILYFQIRDQNGRCRS